MGQKKKKEKIFREGTYILSSFKTDMFKCCFFRTCICIMVMCNLIKKLIYFIKFYIYQTHVSKNAQLKWFWTHQEESADSWLIWSDSCFSQWSSCFPAFGSRPCAWERLNAFKRFSRWVTPKWCLEEVTGVGLYDFMTFSVGFGFAENWNLPTLFPKNWSMIARQQDTKSIGCSNILSRCIGASGCWI